MIATPRSEASRVTLASMTWWNLLAGVVLMIAVVVYWIRDRLRVHAIRTLACKLGFTYLGKTRLPEALSLYGTPFNNATLVWNVLDGERGSTRVIAFDCKVGLGKGSYQRTVIAARSLADVFGAKAFNPAIEVTRSAQWALLYYPPPTVGSSHPSLMPVAELAAHLESISLSGGKEPT